MTQLAVSRSLADSSYGFRLTSILLDVAQEPDMSRFTIYEGLEESPTGG